MTNEGWIDCQDRKTPKIPHKSRKNILFSTERKLILIFL